MCKTKAFILSLVLILPPSVSRAWFGEVVGIADGDTITVLNSKTLKDVKIRLYGIDTPERGQVFSKRAKQFTSKTVYHKVVESKSHGHRQIRQNGSNDLCWQELI